MTSNTIYEVFILTNIIGGCIGIYFYSFLPFSCWSLNQRLTKKFSKFLTRARAVLLLIPYFFIIIESMQIFGKEKYQAKIKNHL